MEKLFIICTFHCSFQYYEQTVRRWLLEEGDGIVIDYELVKINDNMSQYFYDVSNKEDFSEMLNTEWARELDRQIITWI